MISAHTDGEIFECHLFGFYFCNIEVTRFTINIRSNFSYFKQRIEKNCSVVGGKNHLQKSGVLCRQPSKVLSIEDLR